MPSFRISLLLVILLPLAALADSDRQPTYFAYRPSSSLLQTLSQPRIPVSQLPESSVVLALVGGEKERKVAKGGGDHRGETTAHHTTTTTTTTTDPMPRSKLLAGSALIAVLAALGYRYREALRPLLDKHYIQERTLTILHDLEQQPGSLPIYVGGMAVWEFLGLSTIPVETAAGMVFGFQRGAIASGLGKLLGAFVAFGLGRGLLSNYVRTKLSRNPVWSVLNRSTEVHSPMVVALLMKFSCFPEFVKNFGCACLDMKFVTFAIATASHGLMYTSLWTALGVDAAARLENDNLPSNVPLQVCLVVAAIVGLVGSPLLMAWWIRDMKRLADADKKQQ